jgi:hypothetical protein
VPIGEISFVQSLLLLVAFSIAMACTWTFFMCFADLIRDHELSGSGKAMWALALPAPIVVFLAYLLGARGTVTEARAIGSRRKLWE